MPLRARAIRRHATAFEQLHGELEHEIIAEKASTLGRLGRRLERSMRRLSEAETRDREDLIAKVAHDAWCYIVQREVCGLRDHRAVIEEFGIPGPALARMGATGHPPASRARRPARDAS